MTSIVVPAGVRIYSNNTGDNFRLENASWSSEVNVGMRWTAHFPTAPANITSWELNTSGSPVWFLQCDAPDNQADWTSPPLVITDVEVERGVRGKGCTVSGQCKYSWFMNQKNNSITTRTVNHTAGLLDTIRINLNLPFSISYSESGLRGFFTFFSRYDVQLLSAAEHISTILNHDVSYWISTGPNRSAGIDAYQFDKRYSTNGLYIAQSQENIVFGQDYTKGVIRRLVKVNRAMAGSSGTSGQAMIQDLSAGEHISNLDGGAMNGYSIHAIDNLQVAKTPGRIKWFAFYDQFGGNVVGARVVKVIYPYPEFIGSFTDWPPGQIAEEPYREALSYRYHVLPQQGPAYNDGSGNPNTLRVSPLVGGASSSPTAPAEYSTGSGSRIFVFESSLYHDSSVATVLNYLVPWMLRWANRDYYSVTHHARFDPYVQPGAYAPAYDNYPEVRIKSVQCALQNGMANMQVNGFRLTPT